MQTSVEWLIDKIVQDQMYKAISQKEWIDIFEQAKEMEKQQIIDAYEASEMNENEIRYKIVDGERYYSFDNAEDYYNETFKK